MIIKEFRIIIPMSVSEYQIGQLYTIQKKSRIESVGAGSRIEIIENRPFEDSNSKGQYTRKVYHVDERLPPSLKTVAKLLFPKSALLFEEESWNSYPYTRTKFHHRMFKSFNIDIESKYLADLGDTENTFNLTKSELACRIVDYIDFVNDTVNPQEYKPEEDPSLFKPIHNIKRGPLTQNWIANLKAKSREGSTKVEYMCCYKLCRVECAFWGCQSRVEKSIADSVLRNTLLVVHRQAWVWQDEYFNLTIDDVRKLEAETQRYLLKKIKEGEYDQNSDLEDLEASTSSATIPAGLSQLTTSRSRTTSKDMIIIERLEVGKTDSSKMKKMDSETSMTSCLSNSDNHLSTTRLIHRQPTQQSELEFNLNLLENKQNQQETDDILSQNDEFFDAISQVSGSYSKPNFKRSRLIKLSSITDSESSADDANLLSEKYGSSKSIRSEINNKSSACETRNENFESIKANASASSYTQKISKSKITSNKENVFFSNKNNNHQHSQIDTLVLIAHGGNITCTDTSKKSDFLNFKSTIDSVCNQHYPGVNERIAYRLVTLEPICKEALLRLASCSPVASNEQCWQADEQDLAETSASAFALHENIPFSTIPLLLTANETQYRENLSKFIQDCNNVYREFLVLNPAFHGQVIVIGDSIGALFVYDALCNSNIANTSYCDEISNASSMSNLANYKSSRKSQVSGHSLSASPDCGRKAPSDGNVNGKLKINVTESFKNFERCSSSGGDSCVSALDSTTSYLTPNVASSIIIGSTYIEHSEMMEDRLEFDVTHFFVFGSPLGLVLTYRKLARKTLEPPVCTQMYNMFHLTDPGAIRIEPLLCRQFGHIQPCMIPRYSKFPLGDGNNLSLDHFIVKHTNLFNLTSNSLNSSHYYSKQNPPLKNNKKNGQLESLQRIIQTKKNWWGDNRLDYVLWAPERLSNLPKQSLPYLFHSCFWESTDVASFIIRMLMRTNNELFHDTLPYSNLQNGNIFNNADNIRKTFDQSQTTAEVHKWQRRFNRVKLRNLSPNHRSNDVIVGEDKEQVLTAKFTYGPLDFVLSGEIVEIFVKKEVVNIGVNDWELIGSAITDNHGRVVYTIPEKQRLSLGMYQIKMIVKCDLSSVEFYMAVLPTNTQAVVFSIDGSFAANISITGTDPKVRAGAVDVVRHWQDLGYLIIYVTARPDIQHYKVTNWLGQHNFPLGMVFFSNGLRHDPIKQKTATLRNLASNNSLKLQAAYGSPKDILMYSSVGIPANKIFIIAKALKSKFLNSATLLKDGYASHLAVLKSPNTDSRQASGNARLIIKRKTFSIKQNPMLLNTTHTNEVYPCLSTQGSQISTSTTSSTLHHSDTVVSLPTQLMTQHSNSK